MSTRRLFLSLCAILVGVVAALFAFNWEHDHDHEPRHQGIDEAMARDKGSIDSLGSEPVDRVTITNDVSYQEEADLRQAFTKRVEYYLYDQELLEKTNRNQEERIQRMIDQGRPPTFESPRRALSEVSPIPVPSTDMLWSLKSEAMNHCAGIMNEHAKHLSRLAEYDLGSEESVVGEYLSRRPIALPPEVIASYIAGRNLLDDEILQGTFGLALAQIRDRHLLLSAENHYQQWAMVNKLYAAARDVGIDYRAHGGIDERHTYLGRLYEPFGKLLREEKEIGTSYYVAIDAECGVFDLLPEYTPSTEDG